MHMTEANDGSGVDVEYDPDRALYVGTFDQHETEASIAVVEAIAAVRRSDPIDLDPLYHVVDAEALDALVANTNQANVSVSFDIEDLRVTVRSKGRIEIEPPEPTEL